MEALAKLHSGSFRKNDDESFIEELLKHVNQKVRKEWNNDPIWWRLRWHMSRFRTALVVTFIAVLFYVLTAYFFRDQGEGGSAANGWLPKAVAAMGAGATFIVSYAQWQLARRETSFDKYYERLNVINNYIKDRGNVEARCEGARLEHARNMQAFAQLDNVEYVLGKHRLNFVDGDLVERALRAFLSDCRQDWFRFKVFQWVGAADGQQAAMGYHKITCDVARCIARHCERIDKKSDSPKS